MHTDFNMFFLLLERLFNGLISYRRTADKRISNGAMRPCFFVQLDNAVLRAKRIGIFYFIII